MGKTQNKPQTALRCLMQSRDGQEDIDNQWNSHVFRKTQSLEKKCKQWSWFPEATSMNGDEISPISQRESMAKQRWAEHWGSSSREKNHNGRPPFDWFPIWAVLGWSCDRFWVSPGSCMSKHGRQSSASSSNFAGLSWTPIFWCHC